MAAVDRLPGLTGVFYALTYLGFALLVAFGIAVTSLTTTAVVRSSRGS